MTLVRNLPPDAVRCWDGGVRLNRSLSAEGLNTVLMAGRPIWSALRQAVPSYQAVVAQTAIVFGSCAFGIDRTIALVLRFAKKSVGSLPRPSPPTAVPVVSSVVVPMKPVRSKKNGSERTPVQAHRPSLARTLFLALVKPWTTGIPPVRLRARLPVYFVILNRWLPALSSAP